MKNTMKRAHEIKNEAAKKFNCKPSEIIFSICLEMAHKENGRMEHTYETATGNMITVKVVDNLFSMYLNGAWIGCEGHADGMFNIIVNGQRAKCPSDSKSLEIWNTPRHIEAVKTKNAPCPICGTYCHGDCKIN